MADRIPLDPDTKLRRQALAVQLTAEGFPTSEKTLATKATRGGGPPYRLYGRIPIYTWGEALEWALKRLSPLMTSTSERELQPGLNEHREDHRTLTSEQKIVQRTLGGSDMPPGQPTSADAASAGKADTAAVPSAPTLTSAPAPRKRWRASTRRRSS
jgi:hypothetical protein